MRLAALALLAVVLAGCGGKKQDAYTKANLALLARVPVYPGASSPKTTTSGTGEVKFAARDWALPRGAAAMTVLNWYEGSLRAHGFRVANAGNLALQAIGASGGSVALGVRGRTLEAIANSKGG